MPAGFMGPAGCLELQDSGARVGLLRCPILHRLLNCRMRLAKRQALGVVYEGYYP